MAQQHLDTVLTGLGLTTDDLKTIMDTPADAADFKPDAFLGKVRTGVETTVKNDPKFWESLDENNLGEGLKKKIETAQYGRAAGIVKQKFLKTLGMKEEDLADLTPEELGKFETVVAKASEKFASTKASDKQLQADLLKARKDFEDLNTSIPEKEKAIKEQLEQQFSSKAFGLIALNELSRIEGLTSPAKYVLPALLAELNTTYAFAINDFEAVPMQKDKPTLKVIEGAKELTLTDVITKILVRDGLIKKEDGEGGEKGKGKGKVEIVPEGGALQISSHIAGAIAANMPKDK